MPVRSWEVLERTGSRPEARVNDSDKMLEDRNIWLFSSGPEENGGGEKLTMVVDRPQVSTWLKFRASESSGVSVLDSATEAGIVRRRELVAEGKV